MMSGFAAANAQYVFQTPPENFNPKVEVATCFIFVKDQVLFLKRQPYKPEGNTWGIPGGKIEKGEDAAETVVREVHEETKIDLSKMPMKYFGKVYIRYPHVDFIYHMFETQMDDYPPEIVIDSSSHSEYQWLTLKDALNLPLIPGEDECIYLSYGKEL